MEGVDDLIMRNNGIAGYNAVKRSSGPALIVLWAAVLMFFLLLPGRQFHIFAQEARAGGDERCRVILSPDTPLVLGDMEPGDSYNHVFAITNPGKLPLYLQLKCELVAGNPSPGEPGDLFSQLAATLKWRDVTIYSGRLGHLGEPLNISGKIGPIRPGQTLDLDLCISLPGAETGNAFQGATATARTILITACADEEERRPEPPGSDPSGSGELPGTGGAALISGMLAFLLILTGLLLNRRSAREKGM